MEFLWQLGRGALVILQWIVEHCIYINMFLSVTVVFFRRKDPRSVWAWLLVLYFLPIVGFLLFLVFGQNVHKTSVFHEKALQDRIRQGISSWQEKKLDEEQMRLIHTLPDGLEKLAYYNLLQGGAILTTGNEMTVYTDGEDKFQALKKDIQQAKRYVHLQYYIIRQDALFEDICELLKEKRRQGVEIRILYDSMGCRKVRKNYWNMLRQAGISVGEFYPAHFGILGGRVNFRNHRKLVIIDGRVGYLGGFNIGREYISQDERFGYWRDTHMRMSGEAVIGLQIRFALDWCFATKENLFWKSDYFQMEYSRIKNKKFASEKETGMLQLISSGPDNEEATVRDNYLSMIAQARHSIRIQTPYFIPDETVLNALTVAARSGVSVNVMIPCKPDHPFVYWATWYYCGELLRAGGKCYIYENGFLHAKGLIMDEDCACFGTANMDIRSFHLNFEMNATVYDRNLVKQFLEIFENDLKFCQELTWENYQKRSWKIRLKEQISRLLSPLC